MAKLKGEGTFLQLGSTATPPIFANIAQVNTIDLPSLEADEVEETDLESEIKETRASSIPDPGELGMEIYWDPEDPNHQLLRDLVGGATRIWRTVYNNGTDTRPHDEFNAWVKSFQGKGVEQDSDLMADVSLRVTSKPVRGTTTLT